MAQAAYTYYSANVFVVEFFNQTMAFENGISFETLQAHTILYRTHID